MEISIVFTLDGSDERTIKVEPPKYQPIYHKDDSALIRLELKNIVYRELVKRGETPQKIEIIYASII